MIPQDAPVNPEPSLYGAEPAPVPTTAMSFPDLVVGLFTEPGATFERLRARPEWLTAMLVLLGVTLALGLAWALRADHAAIAETRFEVMAQVFRVEVPAQAVQEAADKAGQSRPILATALGSLFGPWLVSAVIGLLCWGFARIGNPLAGDPPAYRHGFALATVHQLVLMPAQLATILVMALKPVGGHSVMALNPLTLGYYFRPENPWMRGLVVGLADPLYLLSFVILAIGMRRMLGARTWSIAVALGIMALFGLPMRFLGGMF